MGGPPSSVDGVPVERAKSAGTFSGDRVVFRIQRMDATGPGETGDPPRPEETP